MFFRKKLFSKTKRGAMSIEMLGVIAVIGMFIGFAASQSAEMQQTTYASNLAQQLNMAVKGGQNYLDANTSALLSALKDRDFIVVTQNGVGDAVDYEDPDTPVNPDGTGDSSSVNGIELPGHAQNGLHNYMPVNFQQTRYGQKLRMYVYKGSDGAVHGLMTTSGGLPDTGDQSSKNYYLNVARKAANMNGFGIMSATSNSLADNEAVMDGSVQAIVGPSHSWEFIPEDEDFGNIPASAFEAGQLARPLYAYSSEVKDDMLYRTEIEGHPELNAMQTDLHLNGFQITDTGTITISQKPKIAGGADDEFGNVPPGGNGLVIEPYETDGQIHESASLVCSGVGGPENAKPDGHIFTMSKRVEGQNSIPGVGDGGSSGVLEDDLNGIWMCMNGEARLISDSANSSTVKGTVLVRAGDTVQKPRCPNGTRATIYVTPAAFAPVSNATERPYPVTAYQAMAVDGTDAWTIKIRMKTLGQKGALGTTESTDPTDTNAGWFTPGSGSTTGGKYNYVIAQTMCERTNKGWEGLEGTY